MGLEESTRMWTRFNSGVALGEFGVQSTITRLNHSLRPISGSQVSWGMDQAEVLYACRLWELLEEKEAVECIDFSKLSKLGVPCLLTGARRASCMTKKHKHAQG